MAAHRDSIAFRFPRRFVGCSCILCARLGAEHLPDPAPIFTAYKLVKIDEKKYRDLTEEELKDMEDNTNNDSAPMDEENHSSNTAPPPPSSSEGNTNQMAVWMQRPSLQPWYKACMKALKHIKKDKKALPFCTAVDAVALNIPDYPTIIKHPMDLGTIETKMNNEEYDNPEDFINDMRLVFRNAYAYNRPEHHIWQTARELSVRFENYLLTM